MWAPGHCLITIDCTSQFTHAEHRQFINVKKNLDAPPGGNIRQESYDDDNDAGTVHSITLLRPAYLLRTEK